MRDKNQIVRLNANQFAQPNELTHALVIKVTSKDGSTKELTVRYCENDQLVEGCGFRDNAKTIATYILSVLCKDVNSTNILLEVIELKTMKKVLGFDPLVIDPKFPSIPVRTNLRFINN